MLEKCFQIINGIGVKTEQKLWNLGFTSWNNIGTENRPATISPNLWGKLVKDADLYQRLLSNHDGKALEEKLPSKFIWQAIPDFIGKIAYLDIESTGLSYHRNYITTIAVYDGKNVYTFVNGENLNEFNDFIEQYPAIATFYGKGFDVPFIRYALKADMKHLHFDVCFLLKRLGYKGGLKSIENQLGLSRGNLTGIGGYQGVLMWKKYKKTGDRRYLETLLAYNTEDVLNLEFLLNFAFNGLMNKENVTSNPLPLDIIPVKNPYTADKNVINEFLNSYENEF